jgi:hypothetical protein
MTGQRDWDETDDERDLPQQIDLEDEGYEDDTVECPHCREEIDEDTQQCPYCRQWIENSDSPAAERSQGWFWPIMVAIGVAVILVLWIKRS